MFVEKVLRNQKRIDQTIKIWEENQLKEKQQQEAGVAPIAPVAPAISQTVDVD